MPTFNQNILPTTNGISLGSPNQKWNGYFQTLTVDSLVYGSPSIASVAYSPTPVFDFTSVTSQMMTLTGNVTSSTVTGTNSGRFYVFSITQDEIGGRTFVWPTNFKGLRL